MQHESKAKTKSKKISKCYALYSLNIKPNNFSSLGFCCTDNDFMQQQNNNHEVKNVVYVSQRDKKQQQLIPIKIDTSKQSTGAYLFLVPCLLNVQGSCPYSQGPLAFFLVAAAVGLGVLAEGTLIVSGQMGRCFYPTS